MLYGSSYIYFLLYYYYFVFALLSAWVPPTRKQLMAMPGKKGARYTFLLARNSPNFCLPVIHILLLFIYCIYLPCLLTLNSN